jgi:WD40 repeat protein
MREIRVCPDTVPSDQQTVRRLVLDSVGGQVFAWVGEIGRGPTPVFVVRWETAESRCLLPLNSSWTEPALSPDFRYLAMDGRLKDHLSGTRDVLVLDLARGGEKLPRLAAPGTFLSKLTFTPNGKTLLVVWPQAGASHISRLVFDTYLTRPGGQAEEDHSPSEVGLQPPNSASLWELVASLASGEWYYALCVSADSRLLAVGTGGGVVRVIDLRTGTFLASYSRERRKREADAVGQVHFDPAGDWVVIEAGGWLSGWPLSPNQGRAWDAASPSGNVSDFAFHPNGGMLALVDDSGRVHYLDTSSREIRRSFDWGIGGLTSVAFAPDGMTCAAGSHGGRVILWDVDD